MAKVKAKMKARIQGTPPPEQPFSETRSAEEDDHLRQAARSGKAVATFDKKSQSVVVFPKGLSNRIRMMRHLGYNDNYIKDNIKSLIAHEEIHGATPEGFGEEYWNGLSKLEQWAHRKIYPSGDTRSGAYMGAEAFRMRMQEVMGMTPDDISELAGTERLKLDSIYSLQKGVRMVRENLLQRNVRGKAMAMVKDAEIKLNMAERIAHAKAAGVSNLSETRAKDKSPYSEHERALEEAAAEYRATGDHKSANELEEMAKSLRQKYIEQSFENLSETRATTDKQDELLKGFYDAAKKVSARTVYGYHPEPVPKNAKLLSWSNSIRSWNVSKVHGWLTDKEYQKRQSFHYQAPETPDGHALLDANQIMISARTAKDAELIAKHLPPLPLDELSAENNPILKDDFGSPESFEAAKKFYEKLESVRMDYTGLNAPDAVKATSRFMDAIRSPEQSTTGQMSETRATDLFGQPEKERKNHTQLAAERKTKIRNIENDFLRQQVARYELMPRSQMSQRDLETLAKLKQRLGIPDDRLPFSETRAGKSPEEQAEAAVAEKISKSVARQINEMQEIENPSPAQQKMLESLNHAYDVLKSGKVVGALMQPIDQKIYERVLAEATAIQERREGIKDGSFINATDANLAPAPIEFKVENASDHIASDIIDRMLTRESGDMQKQLDVFVRQLKKELNKHLGAQVTDEQAENLAIGSFWKKVASLSGEDQAKLLNIGLSRKDRIKAPVNEEEARKLAGDKSSKGTGKFRYDDKGVSYVADPHAAIHTGDEFIEAFLKQPDMFIYNTLIGQRGWDKKSVIDFLSLKKSERRAKLKETQNPALGDAAKQSVEKRQDIDLIRANNEKFLTRMGDIFEGLVSRIISRASSARESIKPDEIDYNGTEKYSGIHTFHESDQSSIEKLGDALTDGWQRTAADRTASRRVAVVMDKASNRVFMLSAYKRNGQVRLRDPMIAGVDEYMALGDMTKRYRFLHSILLESPVSGLRKAYANYPDFANKFMKEAQQRQMATDSYLPTPMTEEQAMALIGSKVRLSSKKLVDEFGHEADFNDALAQEKIKAQRKLTKEQKMKELEKLQKNEDKAVKEMSGEAKNEQIESLKKDLEYLEMNPQFEAEDVLSGVSKGGGQSFDQSGEMGARLVRGGRGDILAKRPMSEYAAGRLFSKIMGEGEGPESAADVAKTVTELIKEGSPIEKSAIAKIGRAILFYHSKAAKEFNFEEREMAKKDKRPPEFVNPYPQGKEAVGIIADELYQAANGSGVAEFTKKISEIANRPLADKVPPSSHGRLMKMLQQREALKPRESHSIELSTPKHPRQFQVYDKSRPSPAIPEGTAVTSTPEVMTQSDYNWLTEYINTVSQPSKAVTASKAPFSGEYKNYLQRMTERGNRMLEQQRSKDFQIFEGEGGKYYSETRATIDEMMGMASAHVKSFVSRSGMKSDISRGLDGAETAARTASRQASNEVNFETGRDKNVNAAIKAVIAVQGVSREYKHTTESMAWMVDKMAKEPEFKLARSLISGKKNEYIPLMNEVLGKIQKLNTARVSSGQPKVETFIEKFLPALESDKIDYRQAQAIGKEYFKSLRRNLERQAINEGVLSHDGCKYTIDDAAKGKIGILRKSVNEGKSKAAQTSSSAGWFGKRVGRKWAAAADKLGQELDFAEANWGSEKLRRGAIAAAREFDRQYDLEKSNGVNVEFDPDFVPGRYNAEFWNNDSITFGERRVLGRQTTAGKTFTTGSYYEAIGAGPYIPMDHEITNLLEHRVRQGMTKVNTGAWEEAWKGMKDEWSGLPIAANVKMINKAEIADVPAGVDPKAYKIVTKANGTKMAVLNGWDGLYRTLTDSSAVSNNLAGRMALRISQGMKHALLMGDIFHLGRISAYSVSIGGLKNTGYRRGFAALELRPEQIQKAVKAGEIHPKTAAWLTEGVLFNDKGKPQTIPRIELVRRFEKAGLNVGQIQDALYKDMVHNIPLIGWYQKVLFDKLTRGLMTNNAVTEFERISKLYPQEDANKILKTVSGDVNAFFGSIGRQGWIKSRTWQDMCRLLFLAPQWVEGIAKKDLAIPYKIATGLHNGNALRILSGRSNETAARAVMRGLGFMFVATQLINLATKGKPTWENEDKEHLWDGYMGDGVYLSPLAMFNEMTHDFVRYNETRPKVWDAMQQIGANKLSVYGRAALILATDKTPEGEYITSTKGIAKAAIGQMEPLPITGKSIGATAKMFSDWSSGKPIQPRDKQRAMSMFGIKTEVGRTAFARMQTEAQKFASQFKNQAFEMMPTDEPSYSKLRHLVAVNDTNGAAKVLAELKKKASERQILEAMKNWERRPLTGSKKVERLWLESMDDSGREAYGMALDSRRELYDKVMDWYDQQPE